MHNIFLLLKKAVPSRLANTIRPFYHFLLVVVGTLLYRHPSRELTVIGVTGTKGKSSTVEMIASILREHGESVASLSTIQFVIGDTVKPNLFKMTTPGRFFVQKFLREAVKEHCTYAVIELSSEGSKQFRHRFIELDALVFTNLSPEHIEAHGSFLKYKQAKLEIAKQLGRSKKSPRIIVANADNEHADDFLATAVEKKVTFSLNDLPFYKHTNTEVSFSIKENKEEHPFRIPQAGLFTIYNALAAISVTREFGVSTSTAEQALRNLTLIRGRVEQIKDKERNVTVVVDYAHTPDSLEKLYQAFPSVYKIAILGNTGGGRDTWKRPEMAKLAEKYCDQIILTNEDPYDENPQKIIDEMSGAIEDKNKLQKIIDRRLAIRTAIKICPSGGYILLSGKGTDPYIMGPNGTKEPWDDASVVREELTN